MSEGVIEVILITSCCKQWQLKSLYILDLTDETQNTLEEINTEEAVLYTAPPPSADTTQSDGLLMLPCRT